MVSAVINHNLEGWFIVEPQGGMKRRTQTFFAVGLIGFCVWYVLPPKRPDYVASDAKRIPTSYGNYYEKCLLDAAANANRCTVWVVKEESLPKPFSDNEVFVAYPSRKPVPERDLEIIECPVDRGPMVICLKNGYTLILESYWDVTKLRLDSDPHWPRPKTD
jgi:hypothetical protein